MTVVMSKGTGGGLSERRDADAFRITGLEGIVHGERRLLHDHATEQRFTRDLDAVKVPRGVRKLVIQARDQGHNPAAPKCRNYTAAACRLPQPQD